MKALKKWPLVVNRRASEFKIFMREDSYIGQPQQYIATGARQQAGALCPIYESSYIKICNLDIRHMSKMDL